MTAPPIIEDDDSFEDIENDLRHGYLSCLTCPLTAALAAPFAALRAQLPAVRTLWVAALEAVEVEEIRCQFIDDALDLLLDEIKVAILAFVKGDYDAAIYKQLFGGQSPSVIKRPMLGDQLTTMRVWPPVLTNTGNPTLQDIATRLLAVVAQADTALAALALAQSKLDAFNDGPRRDFVAQVNAARGVAYGDIKEIALNQPEPKPTPGFAERFFLHDTSGRARSIAQMEGSVARLQSKLAKEQATLAEAKQKRDLLKKKKRAAEVAEKVALHKKAQDKAAAAAKDLADLQAEIDKEENG
ncbi:MAG: hypothetical protein ABI193_20655 [Minicystis sp.]